ncbi:MAG: glycosyltransferase [Pirellulales bacterium]|nr:glycosyltransferase [Pirellulales bacterium]
MATVGTVTNAGGRRLSGTAHPRPRVSIITATFNARGMLPATLASVAAQTLEAKEYLVLDGGSRDGTLEVLAAQSAKIDLWQCEPDRGIYDALNKGVAAARGEWLLFLGAGDTLAAPDVLERALEAAPPGSKLIYGDVLIGAARRLYGGRFSRLRIARQNICHQAILYHRELFARWGGYDLQYRVWADWAFNLRAFAADDVRPHYLGLTVACYDDGGFSSSRQDAQFLADAPALIRPLGRASLAVYGAKQIARRLLGRS